MLQGDRAERNALIYQKFLKLNKPFGRKREIYKILSKEFDLSPDTIQRIILKLKKKYGFRKYF